MPEGSLSDTYSFSVRYITAFLHFGILDSTSALCLGVILNSESINKKQKVVKSMDYIDQGKDTVCIMKAEIRRQSPLKRCEESIYGNTMLGKS